MVVQPLQDNFFQANLPDCAEGKLSDVYYTIYNSDGSVKTAKTQTGVVEIAKGRYGVVLSFPVGNYSILWELKDLTAGEDINAVYFNPYIGEPRPVIKFTV